MKKRALVLGMALSLLVTGCSFTPRSITIGSGSNDDSRSSSKAGSSTNSSTNEDNSVPKRTSQISNNEVVTDFGGYDPSQDIEVKFEELDKPVTIKPHEKDQTGRIGFLFYDHEGNEIGYFNPTPFRDGNYMTFTHFDAIDFTDFNFDGITDLVVIGDTEEGKELLYCYGYIDEESESKRLGFYDYSALSLSAMNFIGNSLTIDKAKDFLFDGHEGGEFDSYQEAYDYIENIRICSGGDARSYTYDLVDFDGDDTPEFIVDCGGFHIDMYGFSDGRLYQIMSGWGYNDTDDKGILYFPGQSAMILHQTVDMTYDGGRTLYYFATMDKNHRLEVKEIEESDVEGIVSEYQSKNVEESYMSGQFGIMELFEKLGRTSGTATKLEGDDISFDSDGKEFVFKATKVDDNTMNYELSDGKTTASDDIYGTSYKLYLMEKEGGRSFLYLVVYGDEKESTLYIYNLSGDRVLSPVEYVNYWNYSLYNGEITDYYAFKLQGYSEQIGTVALQCPFFVGYDGTPFTYGDFADCIGLDSLNYGAQIADHGETIVTKKDISSVPTSKDPNSEEFEDKQMIPAGTKLTMYRTNRSDIVDYYTEDGLYVRFEKNLGEEGFNTFYYFEDLKGLPKMK